MKPVRFRETIEQLHAKGVRVFVELGASNSLTAFVDNTLKGKDYVAVSCNAQGRPALEQFQHLLGRLFTEKVSMNMLPLYEHRPVTPFAEKDQAKAVQRRFEMVLKMDLPRLSLDEKFLQDFQEKMTSTTSETQPPVPKSSVEADTADRAAVLASHFELMKDFLNSQARVSEEFGKHIKDLSKD